MKRDIETIRIPHLIGYAEMLARQHERRQAVAAGCAPNTLYLLEHHPVITLGRNARRENILLPVETLEAKGIDVVETDRGGGVTYHGPGQLVAYPILDLNQWRCSIGWYLRSLEEVLIRLLDEYGLRGERVKGYTGVWVGAYKVAAIGVAVHQWIAFHGSALNVAPDMDHFRAIVPCGIPDKPVASLEQLLGAAPPMPDVMTAYEGAFRSVFGAPQQKPATT